MHQATQTTRRTHSLPHTLPPPLPLFTPQLHPSTQSLPSNAGTLRPANILIGIPKKGRLNEKVSKLLDGAGLEYRRPDRVDVAVCTGLPVTLVFLPAADIAAYVGEGNVDMGITGQDILMETRLESPDCHIVELLELGFGKCSLSLQAPVKEGHKEAKELSGGRVVTSFPALTRAFFDKFDAETGRHTSKLWMGGWEGREGGKEGGREDMCVSVC